MFSTKHVCRHLRGFQGGNAAQCAERSYMRHVWSTMQHNSSDTSVPLGKLITSIRFVRVTPVLSLQLYKASVCLEFKHTGEATPQEKGSLYWENTAAHKTNTSGANSLKKRLVLSVSFIDHTSVEYSCFLLSSCSLLSSCLFLFCVFNIEPAANISRHDFQEPADPQTHTVTGLMSRGWACCLDTWLRLSFHSLFFVPLSRL